MAAISQPNANDAVLGGQQPVPVTGAILGGIEGLRQRLSSPIAEQRIAAIATASQYGEAGLKLIEAALQDPSAAVQKAAYLQLFQRQKPEIQQALQHYDVYQIVECLYTLSGHAGGITAVALSPDGQAIVSAGRDATLRVWDLQSRAAFWTIAIPHFVYAIAISSDNRTFTIKGSDQTIRAWDFVTEQEIDPEALPTRTISSVAISPNRQRTARHLISGSQNTIKIWNLQQGKQTKVLRGHASLVTSVAISTSHHSNGTPVNHPLLASGSEDKTIKVWGILV